MAKKKLDIKTLHKTLLADTKFIEKLSGDRKQCVLSMKSKKDDLDAKEAKDKKDAEDKLIKEKKK